MHDWNDDRIFERACIGLANEGIDITLISPYTKKEDTVEGVKIKGLKERKGITRRIFSSGEAYFKARNLDADIFHFHDPDLLPWMYFLLWSGRKVIFDIHENYLSRIEKSTLPFFLKNIVKKIWRGLEMHFIKLSGGASVTTPSMANLYADTEVPILVTSNIISLNRLKSISLFADKDSYPSVYTSGTHSDARNCQQTIIAFATVLKVFPTAKLKFLGRYQPEDYQETLSNLSKSLGIEKNVELHGMLSWDENFSRLSKAHIGCVFYEDNLNNRVTIPNRLFEYMYTGTAVLGEYFPEVKRVIEDADCGATVNSSNPTEISAAIISLFSNLDSLKQKGINGKKAVETKYNFEIALKEMIDYYYKIIQVD